MTPVRKSRHLYDIKVPTGKRAEDVATWHPPVARLIAKGWTTVHVTPEDRGALVTVAMMGPAVTP